MKNLLIIGVLTLSGCVWFNKHVKGTDEDAYCLQLCIEKYPNYQVLASDGYEGRCSCYLPELGQFREIVKGTETHDMSVTD